MHNIIRAFVAVEISPDVRARALDLMDQLGGTPAKVKWVEPENLHFTLVFIGDVSLTDSAQVSKVLTKVIRPLPPFEIGVGGAGAFPKGGAPRTLWLGVKTGLEEFIILHDAVEQALLPFGIRAEKRRYTPHITLGRVRGPDGAAELSQLVQQQADFDAGTMFVEDVTLFSSELTEDGPIDELLAQLELSGS